MWKLLKVSHHPIKFGGHTHCYIGDIMILVCCMISQDHIIRGSCAFIGSGPLTWIIIVSRMVAIDALIVEICFCLTHGLVGLHDQSVKLLYDLEPLKGSHHNTIFGGHRHCGCGRGRLQMILL